VYERERERERVKCTSSGRVVFLKSKSRARLNRLSRSSLSSGESLAIAIATAGSDSLKRSSYLKPVLCVCFFFVHVCKFMFSKNQKVCPSKIFEASARAHRSVYIFFSHKSQHIKISNVYIKKKKHFKKHLPY